MSLTFSPGTEPGPAVHFRWLETLWVQITGTLCNIACRHCFIGCGPKATQIPVMARGTVEQAVEEGVAAGARHVYFTGGEPFLHPDIRPLAMHALERAALTIITNGLLLDDGTVEWVSRTFRTSRYSFDLRVSLDGVSAEENDPVRGRGTYERIVAALRRLGAAGLSPVVTVVEHAEGLEGAAARERFLDFVRSLGIAQPRVKFLPLLRIGREERRTHGYDEPLSPGPLPPAVETTLMCASSRTVTSQGVYTCPILVEHSDARLGSTLDQGLHDLRLRWRACQTCILDGLRCTT